MSVEFEDNSFAVKKAIKDAAVDWLHEAAGELVAQLKRNTIVGKISGGQLKNSWDYRVDESAGKATIGSQLENALWEEFGTGEYAVKGNGRKGGWYVHIGNGPNDISPDVVKAYGMGIKYGKGGNRYVFTRGKKPKRVFSTTYNKAKGGIKKSLEAKLRGIK